MLLCIHVFNQARNENHAFRIYMLVKTDLCKPTACLLSQIHYWVPQWYGFCDHCTEQIWPAQHTSWCALCPAPKPAVLERCLWERAPALLAWPAARVPACKSSQLNIAAWAINAVWHGHSLHCGALPFTAIAGARLFYWVHKDNRAILVSCVRHSMAGNLVEPNVLSNKLYQDTYTRDHRRIQPCKKLCKKQTH